MLIKLPHPFYPLFILLPHLNHLSISLLSYLIFSIFFYPLLTQASISTFIYILSEFFIKLFDDALMSNLALSFRFIAYSYYLPPLACSQNLLLIELLHSFLFTFPQVPASKIFTCPQLTSFPKLKTGFLLIDVQALIFPIGFLKKLFVHFAQN